MKNIFKLIPVFLIVFSSCGFFNPSAKVQGTTVVLCDTLPLDSFLKGQPIQSSLRIASAAKVTKTINVLRYTMDKGKPYITCESDYERNGCDLTMTDMIERQSVALETNRKDSVAGIEYTMSGTAIVAVTIGLEIEDVGVSPDADDWLWNIGVDWNSTNTLWKIKPPRQGKAYWGYKFQRTF